MPIDLRSLKKLDFSAAPAPVSGERVVVLVKLCEGAERPDYIAARADISPGLFSAEIPIDKLQQLEADPAVESVELSRRLPNIS
ncbi:hypothetical protein J2W27_001830 [Variovorax boronicumulans]|uniref:hypothetical protein n=1 Tax=Variovorax boronicumulans TaxID=436515 RepID=UPI002783EA4F|nr:hypothetical protein [Variovorax boronicumulans]MDP9909728.1 hypothetical protein [Variovorax boronicumulans]